MKLDVGTLLNRKEDESLEYKEGFDTDDIASTVASFSTNKGGYILIGVKDDGSPKGYKCSKQEMDAKIYDISKNMLGGRVMIEMDYESHSQDSFIVIIKVLEGDKKPYGWKGIFYKRIGSSDEKLSSDQITEISLKTKNLHFDNLNAELFHRKGNINDLDENKIKSYLDDVKKSKRNKNLEFKNIKSFLQNYNFIQDDNIVKNAAVLLFGKNPQEFFPSSKINFLIYSGDEIEETKLKKRIIFSGDLIKQVNEVFQLIRLNTESKIVMEGLRRMEMNQYPLDAIREALINAIVHRDYSIHNSDIIIRLFDSKLELTNPGGLLEGVNIEQLKKGEHHSVRRNPSICLMFDNLGFMEQSGNGIKTIINATRKFGLKEPEISADKNYFTICFYGQKLDVPGEKILISSTDFTPLLTDLEKLGISIIKGKLSKEFMIKDYLKESGIKSRITAKNHLTKFEGMQIIKSEKKGKVILYTKIASII